MADNQIYNQIGNEIKDALKEGLSKGDFSGLNDAISNSVNMAINEAVNVSTHKYQTYSQGAATKAKQMQLEKEREERLKRQEEERLKRQNEARERASKQREAIRRRNEQERIRRQATRTGAIVSNGKLLPTKFRPIGSGTSVLCIVGGAICTSIFGFVWIGAAASLVASVTSAIEFGIATVLLGGSIGLIANGVHRRNMLERARRYASVCGEKMYAKVSQLASATGLSEKKVIRDIKKMLSAGYFPEGYIDTDATTLMLSEDVYKQYIESSEYRQNLIEDKPETDEVITGELTSDEQAELNAMISDGRDAIRRLHELNADIPGEVITEKLDCLEDLLRQIFDRVKEHPEQMGRMHKLMDYYLPTMLKLVEAYAEYDKVSAPGKEILQAKAEIEKTLDTINEAFVSLLNNLFQDSVWDVTSDARVLKTMLTQEGLAKDKLVQ